MLLVHKTSKMNLTRKQIIADPTENRNICSHIDLQNYRHVKAACDFFRTKEIVIGAEQDTGVGN
jgi:RAB protein geranylgeranyltransferase component A